VQLNLGLQRHGQPPVGAWRVCLRQGQQSAIEFIDEDLDVRLTRVEGGY